MRTMRVVVNVVRGAWCVVRGAWCVVRGAWWVLGGSYARASRRSRSIAFLRAARACLGLGLGLYERLHEPRRPAAHL